MLAARRIAPTNKAAPLIAAAFLVFLLSGVDTKANPSEQSNAPGTCEDAVGLALLSSPITPWRGAPLRVVFATEKPLEGELSLIGPNGVVAAKSRERHGGPPYFWFAEVAAPAAGTWHARLGRDDASADCAMMTRDITVRADEPPRPGMTAGSIWPVRNAWNRATEDLFSAWIEKLFDAPLDDQPSWPALHEVLRDRSRNFLFDYLGLSEDQVGMILRPDCADLPYFLRAYFAFKMGLPFGYSRCTRGGHGQPPKCQQWFNIQNPESTHPEEAAPTQPAPRTASRNPLNIALLPAAAQPASPSAAKPLGLVGSFAQYLPVVANTVHSATDRTLPNDNNTDVYPVPLTQDALRPGVLYADPYGHVLMLVKRVPEHDGNAGVFLAVDGQPDGTVARKRFWRGNFLYVQDPTLGGPGFKRFRPIVRDKNGGLRRLTNAEIAKDPQYGDFSLEPSKLSLEGFYDRMDEVMSPEPLDPVRALDAAITALEEQVKTRVISVENGRKYQNTGHGDANMPDGAAIFETNGAWEDFATPSRDLRLLIAIDVVRGFPDRVARHPERYAMPTDKSAAQVKAELDSQLASQLAARKFSYTRSDGSEWTLALKDVIDRMGALEMAYNLNDCVELRWGAPANSEEASTCKRHAPVAQRAKMTEYRAWFHERHRPPGV